MQQVYFITHPNVVVDLNVPVETWDLSDEGKHRLAKMLEHDWISSIGEVYSSTETKAVTTARILAEHLKLSFSQVQELGEMDRSATGPLPPDKFDAVVERFFADPTESAEGWETAHDAQNRIIGAIDGILAHTQTKDNIAIVAHGGVGTLYLCHLKGSPIKRSEDQPCQGNYFVFEAESRKLIQGWKLIEE